jgi:hypothetical protein
MFLMWDPASYDNITDIRLPWDKVRHYCREHFVSIRLFFEISQGQAYSA